MENQRQKFRVAITQPNIIFGGRLQVILGLVKALNDLGIEPDILTFNLGFDPASIQEKYGQDLRMHFNLVAPFFPWRILSQDYKILCFNFLLKFKKNSYDLIIDSGNSQIFLPQKPIIVSYLHFPREHRIYHNYADEYQQNRKPLLRLLYSISRLFLKCFYSFSRIRKNRLFICNSNFTEESLRSVFHPFDNECYVVYPPVNLSQFTCDYSERSPGIVSLGRFTPEKGQLEQVKLAQKIPGIRFKIIGFVFSQKYFDKCQSFVNAHKINNVQLLPNLAYNDLIAALQSSKYFLHTLEDEPFGITAVQAIAAGCIPIVHNSGGQREVVPFDILRYQQLDEIPKIIDQIEKMSPSDVRKLILDLQQNAWQNYDASVFHHRMKTIFSYLFERMSSKE